MSNNNLNENHNEQIDHNKLKRMIFRICQLERENTKTGRLLEKNVKREIQMIIEQEERKCY